MSTLTYAASNAVHGSNYLNEPTSKQKDEMFNDEQMTADLAYEYAMFKKTPAEREAEKKSKLAAEYERFKSGVKPTHREAAKLRIDEAQAVLHFNDTGGRELSPEQQRIRWNRIRHQMALDESDTPPQPVGFGEYLGDASWKGFKERLPVAGDVKEMKDMWAVYRAANRAAENKATDEDLETIADFYEDQAYSARDMTVAGRALNITSHVPTFASEMAIAAGLTAAMGSGVGTAPAAAASAEIIAAKAGKKVAKEAAKKALEKVVFKNLARQAGIGLLEGGVVLPLVKSGKVAADTLEGMMPTSRVYKDEQGNIATEKVADGENLLPALAKSFYRQSVEGVTEKMGGPIDRVLGSALRKAGISSKTLEAYLGKPGTSVAKLNKAFKLGGIDSVVSELLEERIGEVLMAPIDGYELPSGRQLASEALAFSVPGLAKQAIGRGIQATRWGKSQLLTPEGAAEFVREHPEAAAKLAESETPSRATIEGLVESGAVEKETWSADERRQASTLQQEAIQNVEEETENEIFQERQGQAIETDEKSEPTTTQEQELRLAERAEENSQEDIEQEHSSLVESLEYDEEYQRTVQEADDRYTKAADEFNDYVYRKNLRRPSGGKNSKPYQRWKTLTESDKKYRELLSKLTSARLQKGKMEKIAERDFKRRQIESGNINLENVGIAPIEKLPRQFQNSIRREAKYLLDYTDNEKARETLQKIANGQDGDSAVFETQKERIIAHLIGDKAVNAHDRYVNEQYGPKEPLLGIYLRNGTESILEAIDSIDQGKPNELADHVYMSMEHTPFSVKSDARGPLESLLPEYEYDEAFSIRPGRRVPSSGGVSRLPYSGQKSADYSAEPTTPVEAPEMLKLAQAISGSQPLVRKLGKAIQGAFRKGRIYIDSKTAGDPVELAKVLAHEIGHLVDWVGDWIDNTLSRGNLLGRLRSLRDFGREFHPEIGASDSAIRQELQQLSQWWEPFDRKKDPAYTKYRDLPKELYADAVSVMLNNPDALLERAPKFHKAFFEHLDKKPDVKEAFEELRKMLTGPPEAIQQARLDDMTEGFHKTEAVKQDAKEAKEERKPSILDNIMTAIFDKAHRIKKDLKGNFTSAAMAVRYALQELNYSDSGVSLFLSRVRRQVIEPLDKAGLNVDHLGLYQTLKRIMTGRADIANPYGQNVGTASDGMEHLRQQLGEERFEILKKSAERFNELTFDVVEKAYEAGLISEKLFREVVIPNKENWVSFRTIDHATENMPADIKKQVGTFKEHENPYITTTMKIMAMQRAIDLNNAKTVVRDFYKENIPGTLVRVKENEDGKKPTSPQPGNKFMTIMIDGEAVQFECEQYIADVFSHPDINALTRLAKALKSTTYKIFHPLFVTYSLGFQIMNPARDAKRTFKNLEAAGRENENFVVSAIKDWYRLPNAYIKSIFPAWRYAGDQYDPTVDDMLEHRAIFKAVASRDWTGDNEQSEKMLVRHKLMGEQEKSKVRKVISGIYSVTAGPLFGLIERTGNTLETMSKIAAWKLLVDSGMDKREAASHVRRYAGTPDYMTKGTGTDFVNAGWMYGNVMLQGMAADWSVATNPKTAGGYWLRSVMVDFMPKVAMAGAAYGAFGSAAQYLMSMIPDYDKLKYTVIPLGIVKNKKTGEDEALYIRQAHDDVNRPICGLLWEMTKGKDANISKMISSIFGEIPNRSPLLSIGGNWLLFGTGQNPKDYFRGKDIISRRAFSAGGMPAVKEMTRWTANQFGVLSTLAYPLIGDPKTLANETNHEKLIKTIPGFNRIVKQTNAGLYENEREVMDKETSEKDRRYLMLDPLIQKHNSERYNLNSRNKENLSEYDNRKKMILNGFYKNSYTPITKRIDLALDNGREEEAKRLRAVLAEKAKETKRQIENTGQGRQGK